MKKKIKKRLDRLEAAVFGEVKSLGYVYVIIKDERDLHNIAAFIWNKYPEEFNSFKNTHFENIKDVYFHFSESCWHYGDLVDLAPEQENLMKRVTTVELLKNYL